jgi:glycosyltransferase involved in cell wall biosynthesis
MTLPGPETASGSASRILPISIIIPTYQRERVLVDTIAHLLDLEPAAPEILVVDQTAEHEPDTQRALAELVSADKIRWIRLSDPSITHAMNVGLEQAGNDVVLFIDDDIIPGGDLITAHASAHVIQGCNIVAGQVLQPGEEPVSEEPAGAPFRFCSSRPGYISELMGGNFSIKRNVALGLGGFDENFVQVAYRFEAEFAERALAAGEKIWFEPEASIRHLKSAGGGTRSYGDHLKTIRPSHSVGAYYYLFRSKETPNRLLKVFARPIRAVRTKHHLTHPWWILPTLLAEAAGFFWAVALVLRGPRLLGGKSKGPSAKSKELSAKS